MRLLANLGEVRCWLACDAVKSGSSLLISRKQDVGFGHGVSSCISLKGRWGHGVCSIGSQVQSTVYTIPDHEKGDNGRRDKRNLSEQNAMPNNQLDIQQRNTIKLLSQSNYFFPLL
jgi:hypothetical protein